MSFDRVAEIYDATRGLPIEVLAKVVDAIVAATNAGPETRFLEIGIGTGRIALPFVERGYSYTGVDISQGMVSQLRAKAGEQENLTVVTADVTDLPFPDGSFDVVISVHVLHLVPEWERALSEVRRVLKPEGFFVLGQDRATPESPASAIRDRWVGLREELGIGDRPGYGTWDKVEQAVIEAGAFPALYRVASWEEPFRPADFLDAQRNRVFSHSWSLSDEELKTLLAHAQEWALNHFGSLDEPLPSGEEFVLEVSRFPSSEAPA